MLDGQIRKVIRKHAIKNAVDYGEADEKAVLGKVLAEVPGSKSDMKELNIEIARMVKEVNSMGKRDIEKEYENYRKEFQKAEKLKAEKTSKPRFELEGAETGRFSTRFPPEPNGYIHVGNAKAAFLERELADVYKGELYLYFDDTNPEKERQEFVDQIKNDLKWLGIGFDREYYASDHLEEEYGHAEKLVKDGNAYVCQCRVDEIKRNRGRGITCEHRKNTVKESLTLWRRMLDGGFKDNEAVLRLRGDMGSLNTVMRDPVLLRIKSHPHYRHGERYIVWPTYDFNTAIVDSIEGVTDPMRSKEYELRNELYYRILDLLGLRKPRMHIFARLQIKDSLTSKRKVNELIKEGLISGYDDPRLVTIAALRRRGIQPEAIKRFVLRFGLSNVNSEVGMDMLLSENRKIVDKIAKRLFFVEEPVRLRVSGMESFDARIRLHPEADLGYRTYRIGNELCISRRDAAQLKRGDRVRLKDLFNVEISNLKGDISCRYMGNESIDARVIQWVSEENSVKSRLLIPGSLLMNGEFNKNSLQEVHGLAESYADRIDEGEIVQFERIGFFRLDNKREMLFIGS